MLVEVDDDDDVAMGGVIMVMLELLATALGVGPAPVAPPLLLFTAAVLLLLLELLLACRLISIKRSIRPFLKFSCLNLQYFDCSFSATGSILSDTLSIYYMKGGNNGVV